DVQTALIILALELLDLLDHHLAQAGEFLDLATQEERLELAVVGDEVVGVFIVKRGAAMGTEEEHRGQRLVEVQAKDLAKGGVADYWRACEYLVHAVQCLGVVQSAQDAVVEDAYQRPARLVAHEALEVTSGGFDQRRAFDHHQLLAGRDVAEQVYALVG